MPDRSSLKYPASSIFLVVAGLSLYLSWGFVFFHVLNEACGADVPLYVARLALIVGYAGVLVFAAFFAKLVVPLRPAVHLPFLVAAVAGVFMGGYSHLVPGFALLMGVLGSFAVGLDYGWHLLFWSELFGYARSRCAGFCFASAFVVVPVFCFGVFALPHLVQVIVAALLPVCSHVGFSYGMKLVRDKEPPATIDARASKLGAAGGSARAPWRTSDLFGIVARAIVTVALFGAIYGVVDVEYGRLYWWAAGFGIVGLLVAGASILFRGKLTVRFIYRVACLFMVAGLLSLPFFGMLGGVLVATAHTAALFLLVITFCEVANRFETSVVGLAGFAFGIALLSSAAGKLAGVFVVGALSRIGLEPAALTAVLLLAFVAYTTFMGEDGGFLLEFSDEGARRGVRDPGGESASRAGKLDPRDMEVSRIVFHEAVNRRCLATAADFGLSNREEEVLCQIMRGDSIQEVADKLFISPGTVKTHINHIYKKMGIRNRQELKRLINLE